MGAALCFEGSFYFVGFLDVHVIIYLIEINYNSYMRAIIVVKNNIEVDVKVKCIENSKTQVQLAEEIETTTQYVNRIIKKKEGVVNNTFVQIMEALGYDIELSYVKRV